jgi:site-specific recombinase XerD
MNESDWLSEPYTAYEKWQRTEAAGADRRPFAEQSIIQHQAMFARFHRYLTAHWKTLANYGLDDIDAFFVELAGDVTEGTTTRLRYLKLVDRLTRHLVAMEIRKDNPAATMLVGESWPEDEPTPIFLSETNDKRLQAACVAPPDASFKQLRSVAIVSVFLGSGITAAECRHLQMEDVDVDGIRPDVYVQKRGPRIARRVPLDAFALDVVREYGRTRAAFGDVSGFFFIATATGKPMKDDTLGKCVRSALAALDITAGDMSPRLLRNTYGRRHICTGSTNEQVSNLLGLSSHRTAARLRQTVDFGFPAAGLHKSKQP